MSSYKDLVTEARRQAILLALYVAPGYMLQEELLRDQVDAAGYVATLDRIRRDLDWLANVDLVDYADGKARLAAGGEDVIFARDHVQGVRRARPGDVPDGA